MENLRKTTKVREKQLRMMEKAREVEKLQLEEYYRQHGCPIQIAEQKFFETVNKIRKEREKIYTEINSQL